MAGFKEIRGEMDRYRGNDAEAALKAPMPCRRCYTLTSRETLAKHGAICERCYGAYCAEHQSSPEWMADKRTEGMKAWAEALKAQDASGARLTRAQREMWRAALGEVVVSTGSVEAAVGRMRGRVAQ